MFIYPIYNHNWRNISTIYIYITRLTSNEIFSPSNRMHWEVGQAKDLSATPYECVCVCVWKEGRRGNISSMSIARGCNVPTKNLGICKVSDNHAYQPTKNMQHITASTCSLGWTAAVGNDSFSKVYAHARCFVQCYTIHYEVKWFNLLSCHSTFYIYVYIARIHTVYV
jgi:hypothetical protein